MSDRTPSPAADDALETELVALGRTLLVDPPALDLADRVLARIARTDVTDAGAPAATTTVPVADDGSGLHGLSPARARSLLAARLRTPRRRALVAALAAVLVVVVVPPVRAAVLDLLRIGGVTVREVPAPSSIPLTPASEAPVTATPGTVVVPSLADASQRVGFDVTAPRALGAPTTIAVAREGRVVELTWGAGAGSTRLDLFAGSLSYGYLKSVWDAVTPTDVAGRDAVWFAEPHLIEWTDRDGVTVVSAPRVAGPTLVWVDRDGTGQEITYRLEGPSTLEAAWAIAESVP